MTANTRVETNEPIADFIKQLADTDLQRRRFFIICQIILPVAAYIWQDYDIAPDFRF